MVEKMDDLSEKLNELLSDPESMNRVRQMAENLLGNNQPPPTESTDLSVGEMLGGEDIKNIMSLITRFKNTGDDSRVQLISALKPHLSDEKKEKADMAIKILKLLDMLPLIKESGILKL